ncbi:hypothetical protein, partial [Nitrosomonas aestuarii]|uniref:hypothetical protein n=1 Tax=Nitrosomonas aestuarii TaxID=52441 RepID=UPI001BA95D01
SKVQNSLTALNKMEIKNSKPLDSPYTRFDYSSTGSLVLSEDRASAAFPKKLKAAIFNHSMWLYPCLIFTDFALWLSYCRGWIST